MSQWTVLEDPPFENKVSQLLTINQSKLLVITSGFNKRFPWKNYLKDIWIYNVANNTYTKLISENKVLGCCYKASLHNSKSMLYFVTLRNRVVQLNLNTKQFEISNNRLSHNLSLSDTSFSNGQFHIFGGIKESDKYHCIWDENKKDLLKVYFFDQIQNRLAKHAVQYLQTENSVLIIASESDNKDIFSYSLTTKKCEIFPMRLCESISLPTGVLTRNEQYLILSGSRNNDIFVCDLQLQTMWKSNIKKDNEAMKFSIISDVKKEELLVSGYIRHCWKLKQFLQMLLLPCCLIQIINKHLAFKTVHFIGKSKHVCMSIDKLLQTE